jgi:hypothetical protein
MSRGRGGAIDGVVSSLSTALRHLGREGAWDPLQLRGNPCDSGAVRGYGKGYRQLQAGAGHVEVSAVPLAFANFLSLSGYLWRLAEATPDPLARCLLWRDLCLFSLLWHT